MSTAQSPNISANAGDEKSLSDPNSAESIARRAKQQQVQASEDRRYDAPAGFLDYRVMWDDERKTSMEISAGLFLALGTLLFLYKAAPDAIFNSR